MSGESYEAQVFEAFAAEDRHLAQSAVYESYEGPDANEMVFLAVAEGAPRRLLEVGCGRGELSARMAQELRADVVAVDISPRMVELACARGVRAQVADVRALPFSDGEFDAIVANWLLHYVRRIDRALAELARVLRPGGRLVATTNSERHVSELWELVFGVPDVNLGPFSREKAASRLRRHFRRVERRDVQGTLTFPDHDAARNYLGRMIGGAELAAMLPPFSGPLRASRRSGVFIAER